MRPPPAVAEGSLMAAAGVTSLLAAASRAPIGRRARSRDFPQPITAGLASAIESSFTIRQYSGFFFIIVIPPLINKYCVFFEVLSYLNAFFFFISFPGI